MAMTKTGASDADAVACCDTFLFSYILRKRAKKTWISQ